MQFITLNNLKQQSLYMLTHCIFCLRLCYFVYWMWSTLAEKPHICERKCHEGPCGSCDLTTELTCRCTKFKKEFPCTEVMKLKGTDEFTKLKWKKTFFFNYNIIIIIKMEELYKDIIGLKNFNTQIVLLYCTREQ